MQARTILLIIAILSTFNSIAQKRLDKQNFAEMYNINSVDLHPKFQVYHNSDTTSILFYELDNSELKYEINYDSSFSSKAKIHYRIYNDYKAKLLVDSGSYIYIDSLNYRLNNSSLGQLPLNLIEGSDYVLLIYFTDLNTKSSVKQLIEIEKINSLSRQYFYLKGIDQLPYLKNYMNSFEEFSLINQTGNEENINIRYFKQINNIPKPPMIENVDNITGLQADTLYNIPFKYGETGNLKLSDKGFYHFFLDSKKSYGYTVFRFANEYPYIVSDMQLLLPLRYITSGKEFKALYNSNNKSKDIEDFWIKLAGDKESAQGLMDFYYNKVQNANLNFTSDREGWSTDRGMIYIIYGEPDMVYKNAEMETWKYKTDNNDPLIFDFYKVKTPFSNNHFNMQRLETYKYSWNTAIQNIRK